MLKYTFMQKAFIVGILLGLVIPLMGILVVNRRTSTVGDALSHSSLAGIGIGLLTGITPTVGAILVTLLAAISIELVRGKYPKHGDLATALVMSTGVGLASILSDIVPTSMSFESYLFGSIISISDAEVVISFVLSVATLVLFSLFYQQLLYISVDRQGARIAGISVRNTELLFTILLAMMVAISSRVIGVLMVSSLMILPVASAMTIAKSYLQTVRLSSIFGVAFVISGLYASYYLAWKPGGAIVLIGVFVFISLNIAAFLKRKWAQNHLKHPETDKKARV